MKTTLFRWGCAAALSVLLCSCAGSGSGIKIMPQTAVQYPPVPVAGCRVSSHPPKGTYTVIAFVTIDAHIGESATHLLQRLQSASASLGADYVMVTSVSDRTFLTPQNVDSDNIYLADARNFDSTAGSEYAAPPDAQTNLREIIQGQALKITSGSNAPNKKAPSMLWQIRAGDE